ncbi:MAG: hypothetical protein B7X41_21735 [Microbacterium sp. 14-71-5]|nr:MAG: hypothetical protein B7X41_21735 [Microbacterium sp. 14-71-5]OZB84605.1 MAG: hypothetical protein B7X32_06770 [Microbacterium sp. 13-71-7]
MSGPRILVVEHEANAGAGVVGRSLEAAGARLEVVGPEAGTAIPAALSGFDGLIVLGGSPGPTDDDDAPWLVDARRLVAEALDAQTPFLGICLGAQILAVVAGGAVSDAAVPEVGLTDLELTPEANEDPLLGGLGDDLRAMQWHFLEVTELPSGSVSLCRSDACRNQAFRVGAQAWGVQFHLEADAETARAWAEPESAVTDLARVNLSSADVIEPMRAHEAELSALWAVVARRWLDVVTTA